MRLAPPFAHLAALALAALATLGLAACDSPARGPRWQPAGATTPRDGGTLRFSTHNGVSTLDPALANDEVAPWLFHPLLDTLVDYAPGSIQLIPRLAESWEVSSDERTYRFRLRDGLRYEDGRPIVAADFKYALERPLQLETSPLRQYLAALDCGGAGTADVCPGIRVLGDRELEIRLAKPDRTFIYILAMKLSAPLRKDYAEAAGDQLRRRPLASGPYRLVDWIEGQRVVLERNPHYRDKSRQHLDRIVMLELVPRDVQFLMFERGELDTAERLSAPDLLWVASRADWAPYIQHVAQLNVFGSRMDTRHPPFTDRRVRQALNYALHKDYTTKLLTGTSQPAHGILPPVMPGSDSTITPYPYDPAKARALLAEAGYAKGLVLDYMTIPDEDAAKLAASMKADFAEVGVTLNTSEVSFTTYLTQVGKAEGGLPFSFAGWFGDFPDPSAMFDPKFHSRSIAVENSANDTFYKNPELDQILDEARGERDPEKRAVLYRRADRIVHDDAPWIWNYHQVTTEVSQPYVRGYTLHPMWIRDFTTAWLDLGPDGEPVPR